MELRHLVHQQAAVVHTRTGQGEIEILLGIHLAQHDTVVGNVRVVCQAEHVGRGTAVDAGERRRMVGDDRIWVADLRERSV